MLLNLYYFCRHLDFCIGDLGVGDLGVCSGPQWVGLCAAGPNVRRWDLLACEEDHVRWREQRTHLVFTTRGVHSGAGIRGGGALLA